MKSLAVYDCLLTRLAGDRPIKVLLYNLTTLEGPVEDTNSHSLPEHKTGH